MKFKISLFLFFLLATFSQVFGVSFSTTLDANVAAANPIYRAETGLQSGRLNRNGVASSCGAQKTNPGTATTVGDRRYDEFEFVALSSGCVTVTLSNAGNNVLFVAAYNQTGINVANTSFNYLADAGSSPTETITSTSFSFDVIAGQVFNVVVSEVNVGGGTGQGYTLDVTGVKIEPDFSVSETLDVNAPKLSYAYSAQSGNQTGRINRDGTPSNCGSTKANPGVSTATGTRRRDLYRITPFFSGCATVTLSHTGSDQIHAVVYNQNGFDPNNTSANYLADSGTSATNQVRHFSFVVQKGVPFDLVIHEITPGAGDGSNYTLNISGVMLAPTVTINPKLDSTPIKPTAEFTTSTGVQTGRLNRQGAISTCSNPKPNPGLFTNTGSRQYDRYTFTPVASGCVEVILKTNGNNNLFSLAYNQNGINPADPSANYLADGSVSPVPNANKPTYSFNVTAGVPFTVAVHEVNSGGGIGQGYTLTVRGQALNAVRRAVPFDLDGDRKTDVGIFRPNVGEWWHLKSINGGNAAYQFGQSTDKIVPADFTGDGLIDIAFWRPSTSTWYVLRSEDSSFFAFPFGQNGDIPAPGDFDGDGKADAAVFRPSSATWFINRSSDNGVSIVPFGIAEDKPVVADYDGDNFADIAIFRPSVSQWWILRSTEGVLAHQFGSFGDIPIPADYTGDGRADVAFFRPSNEWYVLRSDDNSFYAFPFGTGGDQPVPGDYDGDGTADPSVFRPSNNTWFFQQTTNGFGAVQFGANGDIPVHSAYTP